MNTTHQIATKMGLQANSSYATRNGRNNCQHYWPNNVGSCVRVGSQPVVCKRLQQLSTMLGPALHRGKDTTHKIQGYNPFGATHACVAPTMLDHGSCQPTMLRPFARGFNLLVTFMAPNDRLKLRNSLSFPRIASFVSRCCNL